MTIRGGGNPHPAMAAMPLREWARRLGALPAEAYDCFMVGDPIWVQPNTSVVRAIDRGQWQAPLGSSRGQPPCSVRQAQVFGGAEDAPSLAAAARDDDGKSGRGGRMLAARVEQKNGMTKDDKNGVMPLDKESPIQAGCGKSACPDRRGLAETVADLGHVPRVTASGREALTLLTANDIDCVLLDLRMPGGIDGIEVLRRIRERGDAPPGIVLTAFATAENTIEAMRLGAFDHLTKPIGRLELDALLKRLPRRGIPLAADGASETGTLIGSSEAMRRVQKMIGLAADSDATVLILGETGTGKELVARALHDHGSRKTKPLSRSTARPYPQTCWRANFLDTSKAPSPVPPPIALARFAKLLMAPSFLTKSATCRRRCKAKSCVQLRSAS
jgi:CheY-like chemotaxis protein